MGVAACHRALASSGVSRAWPDVRPEALLALIGVGAVALAGACLRWGLGSPELGAWLSGAGRAAGLLTGYGAVAMLVLMARLGPVERAVGTGRLARWHLRGSRYVAGPAVACALLAGWAHAVAAGQRPGAGPLPGYPLAVTAAAAGLVLLGIDTALARGHIPYQGWYLLHVCIYVAVIAAFSGQFAGCVLGGAAWPVLLAAAATVVLWCRVIAPARSLARHRLRVVGIRRDGPDVVTVDIGGRAVRELRAGPGQFFRWRFLARGLWWQSRPYPMSAAPGGDTLRITIRVRGRHGDAAARIRPGTWVTAEGPSAAAAAQGRRMLMLARGTGTGPLRAVLGALPPGTVTLIYHAPHPRGLLSAGELGAIAAARGARAYHVTDPGGRPETGPLSAPRLRGLFPAVACHDVYLCGPPEMTAAAVAALRQAGIPRGRIGCGPAGHQVRTARSL